MSARHLDVERTNVRRPYTVATTEQSTTEPHPVSGADFGANEWLVEEMYERYLADPTSVDGAWHDFFADYRPAKPGAATNGTAAPLAPARPTPATPQPVPQQAPQPQRPAPVVPAASPQQAAPAEQTVTLRGAAARVVTNM